MKSAMKKTSLREIRHSLGRYLAIFFIVALGVIMFAGLRVCREDMVATADQYFHDQELFDYQILSTIGYDPDSIEDLMTVNGVRYAELGIRHDVIELLRDGRECVVTAYSLPDLINRPKLIEGRFPRNERECVVDSKFYDSTFIGTDFVIAESNKEEDKEYFVYDTYTIVGLVQSPLYLNYERGTSSVGNGSVSSFAYFEREAFDSDYETQLYVRMDCDEVIYSEAYRNYVKAHKKQVEAVASQIANKRYQRIYDEANEKIVEAKEELDEKLEDAKKELQKAKEELDQAKEDLTKKENEVNAQKKALEAMGIFEETWKTIEEAREEIEEGEREYEKGLSELEEEKREALLEIENAKKELDEIKNPTVYVLDRETNIGYASFDNDSKIVNEIAAVFPIFFFAVAALVCMTTMTRMVEDERTQIGVLKALGYTESAVMTKYLFYSGSAAFLGALFGYLTGNLLFPVAIWSAYGMMYQFAPLTIVWDVRIGVISVLVAVFCSVGATYFSCAAQFHSSPAVLIRPKAPKAGKRIFLERIGFIWKKLGFLKKVSIRNVFRYKRRFVMMIMGIGGCTALVVTALGLEDSFSDIVRAQYREIAVYDISITLGEEFESERRELLEEQLQEYLDSYCYLESTNMSLVSDKTTKSVNVLIPLEQESFESHYRFLDVRTMEPLSYPKKGEIYITKRIAKILDVSKGDSLILRKEDGEAIEVTVGAVCKNYVHNYAFCAKETLPASIGDEFEYKTVYANIKEELDEHHVSASLLSMKEISSTSLNSDTKEHFDSMLVSLNYVVLMVILLAAALAFVVLYNLTNINITERIREIATIKVLGFYSYETASYVFRENLILTALGAVIGLGLGKLLHMFVMNCISVEAVTFDSRITVMSYLLSIMITFGFAVLVNLFMLVKLEKIKMAESLKSVE